MRVSYKVPGHRVVLTQAGPMTCWATAYTMMISWKSQQSFDIRKAVELVDQKYAVMYDEGLRPNSQVGMPPNEFGAFLKKARMKQEPMANLTIEGWKEKLRSYGLLWVGTLNLSNSGLHSRIITGISGDGSVNKTWMYIVDPDGGKEYTERFDFFVKRYEIAFVGGTRLGNPYYQIRHF